MPRLSPKFILSAHRQDPLLPHLLRTCRDLPSACNELRWLQEHAEPTGSSHRSNSKSLKQLCVDRGRGKPLQYIIGSQPFGGLDIECVPGVLIPRWETEMYTDHAASIIAERWGDEKWSTSKPLRILDVCTGTGCIALLLHQLLFPRFSNLEILGIDVSYRGIALARRNKRRSIEKEHLRPEADSQIRFAEADVFDSNWLPHGKWDILISNPPYISPQSFHLDTSRSVRIYEPNRALVPGLEHLKAQQRTLSDSAIGDSFYPRLLEIAELIDSNMVVMEVADLAQAQRIASKAVSKNSSVACHIWRDWPSQRMAKDETLQILGRKVPVIGAGNGRSVVLKK